MKIDATYLSAYTLVGNLVVRYKDYGDECAAHNILVGEMEKRGVSGPVSHLPLTKCTGCNDRSCPLGGDGYWFAKM